MTEFGVSLQCGYGLWFERAVDPSVEAGPEVEIFSDVEGGAVLQVSFLRRGWQVQRNGIGRSMEWLLVRNQRWTLLLRLRTH